MYKCYITLFLIVSISCKTRKSDTGEKVEKQNLRTFNYQELKPWLHEENEKTYVVNFWATWCVPCVKELPAFERLNKEYKREGVEVVLVSLDFSKDLKTSLEPFLEKNKLKSKVIHFEDSNEQFWIKDIDESWTGAIPATLIYNAKKRKFYEKPFHYEELKKELETFLN